MAIIKKATFSHTCSVKALNKPTGKGWDIYNFPNQIKTASKDVEGEDLGGFDLKEATKEHPDHLYVKIFAIKKDEPNDNGDAFDQKELKTAAPSFVGVPLFTNHQNDDVEKARGECVHSWYNKDEGGIYIIARVDKLAYPRLARGIEEGYITGTSMGCSVENSLCSVCHNKANTADDYCSHVANRKNRKFSGDIKCRYHDSKVDTDEKCPLCKSTKDKTETLKHSEQQIFEHNYGLKFIENSFVVNPACDNCGVKCVLHAPTIEKKVAAFNELVNNLIKTSYLDPEDEYVMKLGGVKELESLKNSMNEMEAVVKSMLKQKDNVSMEYVSDLVKAMADIQGIFDELTEMGYGGLPSPPPTPGEEAPVVAEQFPEPVPPQNLEPQPAAGGVQTSDLGGLGNVTLPKKSSKNKEDFIKINQTLINKVDSLHQIIDTINENIKSRLEIGANMATENNDKKTTKTAAGPDNLEVITEKQLMKKEETLHPRTEETYEGITESKEQIAGNERSNDTTSDSPQVRLGTYETITEDQLKSQSALGDAVIHFNDYPDVITEKQWNDFSRDVAGDLPDDYTEQITQAQIRDLLSKHKFIGNVETITEDQLRNISMTDGLKRWAYKEYSVSLIKVANKIVADMISKYGKSPEEIKKVASLVGDDNDTKAKIAFLAVVNSLPQKEESRKAIASKAKYFSKTASKDMVSTIDALILTSADNGEFGMRAEDVLDFVGKVANDEDAMKNVDNIMKEQSGIPDKITTKADAFDSALKEINKPADGLYRIKATMEDIAVPITDKVAFLDRVKKFAQEVIDDNSVTTAIIKIEATEDGGLIIDVQDGGADEVTPDDIGDVIEGPVEDIPADVNGDVNGGINGEETDECAYAKRPPQTKDMADVDMAAESKETTKVGKAKTEIEKKAQMMGGEMGGMGGASQAPGAGATLPQAPAAEAPPLENLEEEPGLGEEGGLDETLEPLPPGSICTVCGSDDVDVIGGKGKCNNCSSEMTYKVEVNVTKWQGVTPSEEEAPAGEEGFEGEGFEMPTGTEEPMGMGAETGGLGEIPAAASVDNWKINKFAIVTKLEPEVVKKMGADNIKIGSISPATGKSNTVKIGEGSYICLDTGTKYKVSYMVSKDGKQVYGQWEWEPKVANAICPSCSRAKKKFVKALSTMKMTEEDFGKLELKDQVDTIIKLKQLGSLKPIKTASKEGTVMGDYKLAYGGYGDKFPIESCVEKLSRRFGKDALCLSGPDEGKPLAESVCNRLKKADVYTSNIAIKIADNWSDVDGDEECITHQVRSGYNLRQAADICSTLKVAVAEGEDFLADDIAGEASFNDTPVEEPEMMEDEVDPFAEEGGGTVTLELPIDVAEQLSDAVDVAVGETAGPEDIGEEGLPEEPLPGEEGLPGEPVEEIGPGELDGETKPMMEPGAEMGGGNPMGEPKSCTEFQDGSGMNQENCGEIGNKGGIPGDMSNVTVKVDGMPVNAEQDIEKTLVANNTIGKVGKAQMDLSTVIDVLNKQAAEREISPEKAQDSGDIGTYTAGEGGSQMGHENETIRTPQKPSVPRDKALMGQEDQDLNPQDKPLPVIPSGDATMGHEKEVDLDGGDNRFTGGDKGQGQTELASSDNKILTAEDEELYHMRGFSSSKKGISSLAERIAKKLAPKEPVAKDPDIQPVKGGDGSKMGKEDKFTADEVKDSEVKSDSGMMGHEKETLENKPDSPKDHPEVYTGEAQMGQEDLDSEKTTKDKGTVIAHGDTESEAYRVAGRMLQTKKIEASELQNKINELKAYKPEQIRDIEKAIFASEKGLDTVSDGKLSQSVQINEASSVRNAHDELSKKLASMFTLGKRNQEADDNELTQLRKTYNR